MIDPCVPKGWKHYEIRRKFRDAEYDIVIDNPDGVSRGVKSLLLNGKPVDGNLVPHQAAGSVNKVEVTLG